MIDVEPASVGVLQRFKHYPRGGLGWGRRLLPPALELFNQPLTLGAEVRVAYVTRTCAGRFQQPGVAVGPPDRLGRLSARPDLEASVRDRQQCDGLESGESGWLP